MGMLMVFLIFASALAYFGVHAFIGILYEKDSPQSNLDIMYQESSQQEKEVQKRVSRETNDVIREILGVEETKEEVVYPPNIHTLSYTLSQNWQKGQSVWQRTTNGWLKWVVQDLLPAKKDDGILSDDVNSRLLLLLEKDKRVNTFKLGDITAGMLVGTWRLKTPEKETSQLPTEAEEQLNWILKVGNEEHKPWDTLRTGSGVRMADVDRIEVNPLLWHRNGHSFKQNPMQMAAICNEDRFYQMMKFLHEENKVYGGLEMYTSMTRAFQPVEVFLIQESGSLDSKYVVHILMQLPIRPFGSDGGYQKRGFRIPLSDFQKQFASGSIRERREE